ncbi:class I SAM-dependent methyltransferase [Salmonella enterica]|nr:class I SAM-dependent methyltransferase [Salmonella enterica]
MDNIIALSEGKSLFGCDSDNYHSSRPDYPPEIYSLLLHHGAIKTNTRVFEIGPGTGQATRALLTLGCHITAIEPDFSLAKKLEQVLSENDSLSIDCISFEDITLDPESFDLGIAATSLHWLNPETALKKSFRLLRPGGWFAMWWTVFFTPNCIDEFQRKTAYLFKNLRRSPSHSNDFINPFELQYEERIMDLEMAGFTNIHCEEFKWTCSMDAKQNRDLTSTFSPIASLPLKERINVLDKIESIVNEQFNGHVKRNFLSVIYLAQKPSE